MRGQQAGREDRPRRRGPPSGAPGDDGTLNECRRQGRWLGSTGDKPDRKGRILANIARAGQNGFGVEGKTECDSEGA
jgi:hypothetical protein